MAAWVVNIRFDDELDHWWQCGRKLYQVLTCPIIKIPSFGNAVCKTEDIHPPITGWWDHDVVKVE